MVAPGPIAHAVRPLADALTTCRLLRHSHLLARLYLAIPGQDFFIVLEVV